MELKPKTLRQLHLAKLLGFASLSLFSLLITLYEYDVLPKPLSVLFIPLFFTICLVPVSLHLVLCSFSESVRVFSQMMILGCVYVGSVCVLVFLLVTALAIDEAIQPAWSVIFIPLWCALLCYFVLCVFLYPGLTNKQNNLQRNAFVLFLYFFVILATSIITTSKLDHNSPPQWSVCLIPLWVGLGLHCLSFAFFKLKPESKECFTAEKIFLVYAGFQLLLLNLHLETSAVPIWLTVLPFWISQGVWLTYVEVQYFTPTPEHNPLLQETTRQ
jgi:hypothetical protein